ncbi:MAG: hypothetical protein E7632_04290 [Ruminococcaceae bacterium]|nr:hypothetical protein [Oscillospiraceae bacterium]
MTDAAFKKSNNSGAVAGQRISTHPSYTEYSWDSLARPNAQSQRPPQPQRPTAGRTQTARTAANPAQRGPQVQRSTAAVNARRDRMQRPVQAGARPGARTGTQQSARQSARQTAQRSAGAREAAKRRAEAQKKAAQNRAKAAAALKVQAAKADKLRKRSIVAIHTIVSDKKYSFPMAVVLIALSFTILIMAIVTTSVQITEITSENATLQRTYNSLVSEENELRLRLETRDDLRVVETMAKTELGMVKKDQVDRYYLTVHKEDKIEIVEETVEEKPNIFDGLLSFGGSVVERVRAFFGL